MSHVLLVSTSYSPDHSGREAAGSFVADFVDALAERVRLSVVAPSWESGVSRSGSLDVIRFRVPRHPVYLLGARNPLDWPAIAKTLRAGARAVREAASGGEITHLLALWALPSGYWARSAGRRLGLPYSTWSLGRDIYTLGRVPLVRSILRGVLEEAEHRFADGFALAREVEAICGRPCGFLPSARLFPARRERAPAAAPPYRLAYLGRWHEGKGTDVLFETLARLAEEDWRRIEAVRVCGGGPLEALVERHTRELRAAGRPVEMRGYLTKQEAVELLEWTDFVLIPSREESVPVIFCDALQADRPVVAAPAGDLPVLLSEGRTGVLAPDFGAPAYLSALREALRLGPSEFAAGIARERQRFSVSAAVDTLLTTWGR